MAVATLDELIAARKQQVNLIKTASRTAVAAVPFSVFDQAGTPGAGTLAVGNTAAGIVPTDATNGYPAIDPFDSGQNGYIAGIDFGNTVACRMMLYDTLFSAGAYAFNANVNLASQPSFASRVPDGDDFKGLEIWIEAVTAFTGNLSVAVGYTNALGVTGRSTGTVGTGAALIVGRMHRLPLQVGDDGVSRIDSVVASVATAGTFNVHVMRRLWSGRVIAANAGDTHDFLKTGLPMIYDTSALRLVVQPDSTATGIPDVVANIAIG